MGDQREGGYKGILKPGADVPISLLQSGMWDARDMIKDRWRCGTLLLKKDRGDWVFVLSSHDR